MIPLTKLTMTLIVCTASIGLGFVQEEKKKDAPKPQRVNLAADLVAEAPGSWKVEASTKQFRLFEITIPSGEKGVADGVLVVTHFGPGGGGDLEGNLTRWYGMILPDDSAPSDKAAKKPIVTKSDAATTSWVDLSGTYLDRPFPASPNVTRRPKYRMFAAMIEGGKEGPYWIRGYGPEAVMKANRDGFEAFLKSISKK